MKRLSHLVAIMASCVASQAWAEVCLTDDGFVVPCPPGDVSATQMQFATAYLPTRVGVPTDVYLSGGNTLQPPNTNFIIRANKQPVCTTDEVNVTPIRHCTVTMMAPGTYTFDAMLRDAGIPSNARSPYPVTVVVSP